MMGMWGLGYRLVMQGRINMLDMERRLLRVINICPAMWLSRKRMCTIFPSIMFWTN
jgi:hypothetical protein